MSRPVILVHGGAGPRTPDRGEVLEAGCLAAARVGWRVLAAGGDALSAVVEAVAALEDDPEFNAGRGAVLTRAGTAELDAAVMRGTDRAAGAVAGVTRTRNPVRLARAVLGSEQVLLVGAGADAFAREVGLEAVEPAYFVTDRQRARLAARLRGATLPGSGTVGAVALDAAGGVAAATSTGGMIGKRPGRVGDTPLIGAGTYASPGGAASATGVGECIMRAVASFVAVEAIVRLGAQGAAERGLAAVAAVGGAGGLIVMGPGGDVGLARNTPQMAHAWVQEGEERAGIDA